MKSWLIIGVLVLVVGVPFLLRPKDKLTASPDQTLVVITPHNEAIRSEFGRAFREHMRQSKNQEVAIDWRIPGGASEVMRYLDSEYLAAFSYYWTNKLKKNFSLREKGAFANGKLILDDAPADDSPEQAVRRTYLGSQVSSKIDVLFGGGSFDFSQQASKGNLVDCGLLVRHPEWFGENGIPIERGGEPYYDRQGRWFGACLSSFGICYNTDSLKSKNIAPPTQWEDLANPRFFRQIALADPTQSGSITKAFEMIVQHQIQEVHRPGNQDVSDSAFVSLGWEHAMQMLQKIGANSRYFTDSAMKVPLDVASGDATAGLCIDFYGRFQSESLRQDDGTSRLGYISPIGGTSIGSDPIALLRGAPHPELAKAFIDFVLSEKGQKLWSFKVGSPEGPKKYALRRLPIQPGLYSENYRNFSSDPEVLPYATSSNFDYQAAWTASLFRPIGFIIKAMCIDPHEELQDAWAALINANFPPQAMQVFSDVSAVDYVSAKGNLKKTLSSPDRIDEVRLAKDLSEHFRGQYRKARELAEANK